MTLKSYGSRLGLQDYICPDSMEFKSDYIKIGDRFARVIFLKEYPSFLKDSMLSELTDFSRNMMLSVDIQPIPTDDAVKEVQKNYLRLKRILPNGSKSRI